jgi:AraC-like DNA-binding protein
MAAMSPGSGSDPALCDVIAAMSKGLRSAISRSLLVGASCPPEGSASPEEAELILLSRRASLFASGGRPFLLLPAIPLGKGFAAAEREEGGLPSRAVRRALQVMDERQVEDLSLELVASEVRRSPSHLSRLLVREIGIGFAECLSRLRIERARTLLLSGELSVKEVASLVGFRDPAYFARVFRRFSGMNPAGYRSRRSEGE